MIETDEPGQEPLGYGPGNRSWGANGVAFLLWTGVRGRDTFHAIDVRYAGTQNDDLGAAYLNRVEVPNSSSGYRYSGRFDGAGFSRAFGDTTMSFDLSATRSTVAGLFGLNEADSASSRDKVRLGLTRFGTTVGIGAERTEGAFSSGSLIFDAAFRARIAGFDTHIAGYAGPAQTEIASYVRSFSFASPATASFTCDPGSAVLTAPSETAPEPPHTVTLSVDATRSSSTTTVHVGGLYSRISNALVQAEIADPSALPPGYIESLGNAYTLVCAPAPFNASNTVLQRYESLPVVEQREWFVEAERRFGAVRVGAFVERFGDVAVLIPDHLGGQRTDLIAGEQLPQIPVLRSALTVSAPVAAVTLAVGPRTLSGGNAENRPTRSLVDLGARLPLRVGTLELSAQNVFAKYAAQFATQRNAVPLATTLGAPFPTLAYPIPSSWSIRYVLSHIRH